MLRNYFSVAFRRLARSKFLSLIHILGLSIGISSFFFVAQYINFELSYDRFYSNSSDIFRIALERELPENGRASSADNFAGLRTVVANNFQDVEAVTGFYKTPANTGVLFRYNGRIFNELGGEINADSAFFQVFSGLLVRGDPATALNDYTSVTLSESMAKRIFGDIDPIGQRIQMPNENWSDADCVVTGVFRDLPRNAHFHANFIVPLQHEWETVDAWQNGFLMTYVRIKHGSDTESFIRRLNQMYRQMENTYPALKNARCILQSVTSIHLSSHFQDELEVNGNRSLVLMAALIGLVILLMAWINYINLETARFMTRAREIGVRRIIGSRKANLVTQFLVEYLSVFMGAVMLAVVIVLLTLPYFSSITGISYEEITWPQTNVLSISFSILALGSLFTGICPAFYILRLKPAPALKGNFGGHKQGTSLRRSLVLIQFCASLVLFGFVLIIGSQLGFMRLANKKFDVEQVLAIRNPTAYSSEEVLDKHIGYRTLEERLTRSASVKMITSSSAIPGTEIGFTYVNLLKRDVNDPYDPTPYKTLFVDYNYIPFFGLELLAGRNFHAPLPLSDWMNPWEDRDWLTLILNESAIRALGFNSPEEAVDQLAEFENFEDHFQKHRIIGVIADYHHEAVKEKVLPMILSPNYGSFQQVYYSVRLHSGIESSDAIRTVEKAWKEAFPEKPFEYFFLDEYYDRQFKAELQFQKIFVVLAVIAMLIACLGIIGMTVFQTKSRLKEVSIRKVLGASISSLVALLTREHAVIILLSVFVSIPLLYLIGSEWLSTYPTRIRISSEHLLWPVVAITVMVALTSSLHTWKAANSNPVDHLRNE